MTAPNHARIQYGLVIGLAKHAIPHESVVEIFDAICDKYVFQKERSEDGFEHYQCYVHLTKKHPGTWLQGRFTHLVGEDTGAIRFQGVKWAAAAQQYCSKSRTRVAGPWSRGIVASEGHEPFDTLRGVPLRPWQQEIMDKLEGPAHERHIHWVHEGAGGVGKSALINHITLQDHLKAVSIDAATKGDLFYTLAALGVKQGKFTLVDVRVVLVDLARDDFPRKDFYRGLEYIKNGAFNSTKYESCQVRFRERPHVIVFWNDRGEGDTRWSADRHDTHEIVDNRLVPGWSAEEPPAKRARGQ